MKPQENWDFLKPKTLKSPEQISSWYSSIKELFSKLSQITQLQQEPNYPPQLKWEQYPTYIIVWDIHAWEHNITREMLKAIRMESWRDHIVDINWEWPEKESEAIRILKERFDISPVWLEWELDNDFVVYSKIWKLVEEIDWVNMFGIENMEYNKWKWLWNLLPWVYFMDYMINDIFSFEEIRNKPIYYDKLIWEEYLKLSKEFCDLKNLKYLKESDKKQYLKMWSFVYGYFIAYHNVKWVIELRHKINILTNELKKEGYGIWYDKIKDMWEAIKKWEQIKNKYSSLREEYALDVVDRRLGEFKGWEEDNIPWVIVMWKTNIPWLIDKINKKHNHKANIYVAQ